jgi:hypothetical protein
MSTRVDSQKVVSKRKITVASDDKVSCKERLVSQELRLGQAAACWRRCRLGCWTFATKYSTQDLDRLALRIHGVVGLARKKAARSKRLENNKVAKTQVKRSRSRFWDDEHNVEEVEEVKFSGKRRSKSAKLRKWIINDVMSLHDTDDDFVLGKGSKNQRKK